MPESIISEGKTTNEAIEKGLKELNVSRDKVEININEVKNLFSKKNITRVEITNEVLIKDDKIFFDYDIDEFL